MHGAGLLGFFLVVLFLFFKYLPQLTLLFLLEARCGRVVQHLKLGVK